MTKFPILAAENRSVSSNEGDLKGTEAMQTSSLLRNLFEALKQHEHAPFYSHNCDIAQGQHPTQRRKFIKQIILPLQPAEISKEKTVIKSNPAGTVQHQEHQCYITYLLATQHVLYILLAGMKTMWFHLSVCT